MAIGPVGNAIYVNQQTAAVASEKNAVQNRFELQNLAAAAATNEKEEEVQEVRPPEENQMVDADREHTKEEAEQEMKRQKKEPKEGEEAEEETPPLHRLDIKV
ncbi:MAG: hypothetical protein R3302_07080 [Sulfurimonadaceae bacterium]|nr:hypothetical protein [Sulfurimonadaceae bacterium]